MRQKNLLSDTLSELEKVFDKMVIIETGTIRYPGSDGDGNSTKEIAQWMEGKPHTFLSIDHNTQTCDNYLTGLGLIKNVQLVKSDSLKFLPILPIVHFAYLDSDNEPEHCFQEFEIVKKVMVNGGIIICDDCAPTPDIKAKAQHVLQYCIENKIKHTIIGIQLVIQL